MKRKTVVNATATANGKNGSAMVNVFMMPDGAVEVHKIVNKGAADEVEGTTGTVANTSMVDALILPALNINEEEEVTGYFLFCMMDSLPRYTITDASQLRGYGRYTMPLRVYLQAMRQGDIVLWEDNRRVGQTTNPKRVAHLAADFCAIMFGPAYLSFSPGKPKITINPNHRSKGAFDRLENGDMTEAELDHEITVYVVPSKYATDIKVRVDDQTKMGGNDFVCNLDFVGGRRARHALVALQANRPLTKDQLARFQQPGFCIQLFRLAEFLTNYGTASEISYIKLADAMRGKLAKAAKVKANPNNGQVPESALRALVPALMRYMDLRDLVHDMLGAPDSQVLTVDAPTFMGMYACAMLSNDRLGQCDMNRIARNIVANVETFDRLVSSASNGKRIHIARNYRKIVSMLTA